MSKIAITDIHQVEVPAIPITTSDLSAIVKYAQSQEFHLVLQQGLIDILDKPLRQEGETPIELEVRLGKAFDFGAGRPQFSISAGAKATVHVNTKKDAEVFGDDLYRSQLRVKDGEGYLSLALTGSVTAKGSQSAGDFTLGIETGTSATFEFFRRFDMDDATPRIAEALGQLISGFVLPMDVTDLRALHPADTALWSGKRKLKVSGDFSASMSAVPLASPALPLAHDPVQLNAAATVDVSAYYELASHWQIRTRAVSEGIIELGVYKQHGSDCDLTLSGSAGIEVSLGDKDLLTALIDKLSKDPEADREQLHAAGLHPEEIKTINEAISQSIDRSIHASLSLDLNGLDSDEAAFLYRVELDKLNADTTAAVTAILDGDLSVIDRLNPRAEENGIAGPGITLLRTVFTRTKKTGAAVKLNLIGLLNSLSLAKFVSQSEVIHEPVSGDLIFHQTASGERIGILTLPQAQEKLRKAIFDSILITTTYRSAGAIETMTMDCATVHFAQHSTTNEHTLSDYLDWFLALGLLTPPGKTAIMQEFHGNGSSTCTARVAFNDAACQALYLDLNSQARPAADYIRIGRDVLSQLLMPPPNDPNDSDGYRRDVLENDKVWDQFQGQTSIDPVMQQEYRWRSNDPRIPLLRSDYSVIVWWAGAMSSTAEKIVAIRDFLKHADPATLATNQDFLKLKDDVQKHVMGAIHNSPMTFDLPFGLVALAKAAGSVAVSSGILRSASINRDFGATRIALASGS